MSELTPSTGADADVPQSPEASERPAARQHQSMFADPLVRVMTVLAFGVVILYLAGILGAMMFAGLGSNTPRTAAERDLANAESIVQSGDHSGKALAAYVDALIDVNQYARAQRVIDSAPSTAQGGAANDLGIAQARLYLAQKDYPAAITAADKAKDSIKKQFDIQLKKTGLNPARAFGIDPNFYSALLIKALAQQESGDQKSTIKTLDEYLKGNPMDSSVLVRRGQAKVAIKDVDGAKADFQTALKFVPDDPTALAELKKIGAK